MSAPALFVSLAVLSVSAGGCGDEEEPSRRAASADEGPRAITCGELPDATARRRVALRVVDTLVAPDGQSRRTTAAKIVRSLRVTCAQPDLPGVRDPGDYRPVRPVLKALQAEFDGEEIFHE